MWQNITTFLDIYSQIIWRIDIFFVILHLYFDKHSNQ